MSKNRMMTSLVAYEDSDSEDEPVNDKETRHLYARSDSEAGQSRGGQTQFGLSFCNQNNRQTVDNPYDGGQPKARTSSISSGGFIPHLISQTVSFQSSTRAAQSSSECSIAVKRPQPTTVVVRPYIPKRQRLARLEEGGVTESPQGGTPLDQAANTKLLTEVSDCVLPYLGRRSSQAELPRRVRLRVQAHQGPINTVQWCPVPHLSHLLLTASMDGSVKVWDGAGSGRFLWTSSSHGGAVKDACWTPCGHRLLTGSFDNKVHLTDIETGQQVAAVNNQFRVTCLALQPSDANVFLCGGFSPEVKAWDTRTCKVVRVYQAAVQQTLDILFLAGGREFVSSSDSVSRDSAERTLIAWDFHTTAKMSNQIFHERYTCPSLALHPQQDSFVAQTNGNYIALFSAQRPYKMNKRRRYEGHKVEGFAVGCEFSPDGTVLASGSSTGSVHFYEHHSSRALRTLSAHQEACVGVSLHPVLPAVAATCDWSGEVILWQ